MAKSGTSPIRWALSVRDGREGSALLSWNKNSRGGEMTDKHWLNLILQVFSQTFDSIKPTACGGRARKSMKHELMCCPMGPPCRLHQVGRLVPGRTAALSGRSPRSIELLVPRDGVVSKMLIRAAYLAKRGVRMASRVVPTAEGGHEKQDLGRFGSDEATTQPYDAQRRK
jgi:hypothetical protein